MDRILFTSVPTVFLLIIYLGKTVNPYILFITFTPMLCKAFLCNSSVFHWNYTLFSKNLVRSTSTYTSNRDHFLLTAAMSVITESCKAKKYSFGTIWYNFNYFFPIPHFLSLFLLHRITSQTHVLAPRLFYLGLSQTSIKILLFSIASTF